jgi:hypothetical protein
VNATLLKALIAFVPVSLLLAYSVAAFAKRKTVPTFLPLIGSACLVVVVLTHIAEALHLFPAMGWGDPHSIGHYLDLTSAVGGVALLTLGFFTRRKMRRNSPWATPPSE